MTTRAMVTENHRDANGNAGMIENHGTYPTLEEAKDRALAVASHKHSYEQLRWRQFSPTTWGVMSGPIYTNVLVSLIEGQPSA